MSASASADGAPDPAAAVFDLDGTLVLSEQRNLAVWAAFLAEHGVTLDDELAAKLTGRRGIDSLADLAHLFPGRTPEELVDEVLRVAASTPDLPEITPAPGAGDYVARLAKAGVPLALVTSARQPYVHEALERLGVAGLFDALVTAEDVTAGKPDPEGYLLACRALETDPERTVGFEDSAAGVAAVRAAGMRCVAVSTTMAPAALEAADLVVTSFEGLAWPPFDGQARR
jgi:sugar-phosphatase